MNEEDFKNKKETYIDFLKNDASLQLNWAQKKEVAVWTATVFYLGVIYILYEIHLKYLDGCENHINMILLEVFSLTFLLATISFIWSNFQSIYNSHAYYFAVKRIVFGVLEKEEIPSHKNTRPKKYVTPNTVTIE